jgi:hypothetical protein
MMAAVPAAAGGAATTDAAFAARYRLLLLVSFAVRGSAAASTASSTDPTMYYSHHLGALMAGSDLGPPRNLSTDAALAHCTAVAACEGFTFECRGDVTAGCPPSSDAPIKTYFKTAAAGNADAHWWTYLKQRPKVLAQSFGSHMVLQADRPCLWGFGQQGDAVAVALNGSTVGAAATTVGSNGTWKVCLPPQVRSYQPATVTVAVGHSDQTIEDVLFGEVWVASGQSNMAFSVSQAFNHSAECAAATNPALRLFTVGVNFDWQKYHPEAGEPSDFNQTGIRQRWSVATPSSVCGGGDFDFFSAVA